LFLKIDFYRFTGLNWSAVGTVTNQKLVNEIADTPGTQRKRNVCLWPPLPGNG
jgi:hypothetical protein